MMMKVEAWKTTDGKLFPSKKEAAFWEVKRRLTDLFLLSGVDENAIEETVLCLLTYSLAFENILNEYNQCFLVGKKEE